MNKNYEVATQDQKLKIYYRDESIKVIHNVETFTLKLKILEDKMDDIEYIYQDKNDVKLNVIKNKRYITNFKGKLVKDGDYERATILKPRWGRGGMYNHYDNPIIRVDYEGEIVWEIKEEEKKGEE